MRTSVEARQHLQVPKFQKKKISTYTFDYGTRTTTQTYLTARQIQNAFGQFKAKKKTIQNLHNAGCLRVNSAYKFSNQEIQGQLQ